MYDIYATDMAFERCSPDKERVDSVIPYAVIHFVISGEGYINGKRITKNTTVLSFKNNRMHYYPSPIDPWSYIYIRIKGEEIKKAFEENGFGYGITVMPFARSEPIFQILSLYQTLSALHRLDAGRLIANAIFLLLAGERQLPVVQSKPRYHVASIMNFIDENYDKRITIEEIARKFYLNKNYMRTLFVKQLGLSPKQYLQRVRMKRAAFLLDETENDVALIAKSVGYDDALLFSKMFKQYWGVSPVQYRKRQNEISGSQQNTT